MAIQHRVSRRPYEFVMNGSQVNIQFSGARTIVVTPTSSCFSWLHELPFAHYEPEYVYRDRSTRRRAFGGIKCTDERSRCHRVYGPAQFPVGRTVFPREYGPPPPPPLGPNSLGNTVRLKYCTSREYSPGEEADSIPDRMEILL